jgi:hypothetical protein
MCLKKYGINPCDWLDGLEQLSNPKRPYWFGMGVSDLSIKIRGRNIRLSLRTTNVIDAIFFLILLNAIKTPNLNMWIERAPASKYVDKAIELEYYIDLSLSEWPWPERDEEIKRLIETFNNDELAEFIAGLIDGDGAVWYNKGAVVRITSCENCQILDILREIIAKRYGIVGFVRNYEHENEHKKVLEFGGEDAVRLLKHVIRYMYHPLRKLRAELILLLHDGKISPEEFELYDVTKYEQGRPDMKRNNALAAITRAAPQTYTHGVASPRHLGMLA